MDFKVGNKHWVPVLTTEGIRFQEILGLIWEPNPFPKDLNAKSAKSTPLNEIKIPELSNQLVTNFQSTSKGVFSKKGLIQFAFGNGRRIQIEPIGADFLDMDIQFEILGNTYHPKEYDDVSNISQPTIETLTMERLNDAKLFQAVQILNITAQSNENRIANTLIANSVIIEGVMSFSKMEKYFHDHDDKFYCTIYPDRMYEVLSKSPKLLNTKMEIQFTIL